MFGILRVLMELWSVNDLVFNSDPPDVLAGPSYGIAAGGDLTNASREVFVGIARMAARFPEAAIVFGSVRYFAGYPEAECDYELLRKIDFLRLKLKDVINKVVYAGPVMTTIEEAQKCKEALAQAGIFPRHVVLIAGPAHSRTAKYVWEKVFPGVRTSVQSIPFGEETQPDQKMIFGRWPSVWLAANVARHIALLILGMRIVGHIRQPATYQPSS